MISIIGVFFVTGISQLIIYPYLSRKLDSSTFGSFLTVIGVASALAIIFGSSLMNMKLLTQNDYVNELENKDFKKLLLKSILFIIPIVTTVTLFYYRQSNVIDILLINILAVLTMMRAFMVSYYRIDLNYKFILYHLIATGAGYLFGVFLYRFVNYWEVIFLSGEVCAFLFAYRTTKYRNEEFKTSKLYKKTQIGFIQIIAAGAVTNVMIYIDRILINPILGAANVTIYFIASLIGKTLGLVLQPVASMIFNYIAKDTKVDKKKIFMYFSVFILILGVLLYIASVILSPMLIKLLYPKNFIDVKKYLNIANLGAVIAILGGLIQPFSIKYAPLWWQSIIEITYGCIYILGGIIFMSHMQLYGFCLIAVIANLIRLVGLLSVGVYYIYFQDKRNRIYDLSIDKN